MIKLAFILDDDCYFKGGVKPILDLALGLRRLESNPYLISIVSSNKLKEDINNLFPELDVYMFKSKTSFLCKFHDLKPDLIISSDYPKVMKILVQIKEDLKIRVGVYAHFLFGINTFYSRSKSNIKFRVGSLVPWRLLAYEYKETMEKIDVAIANSYTIHYVLIHFYGIRVNGVVCPTVGINFHHFTDILLKEKLDHESILVYVGHYPDYYIMDICKVISEFASNLKVNWFGGQAPNAECHKFIRDNELSKLYTSSIAAYIALAWEGFGYLGSELLLFGMSVLVDTYQPWLEGFHIETGAVKVSDPKENIVEAFEKLLNTPKDMNRARKYAIELYSAELSARKLLKIMRRMK